MNPVIGSTADIRRSLLQVREFWKIHHPDNIFCISDKLPNGMRIGTFCFLFQHGHHVRRHLKSASSQNNRYNPYPISFQNHQR